MRDDLRRFGSPTIRKRLKRSGSRAARLRGGRDGNLERQA
jgi:hypothetical protein